jgi:replicative DNA helicase
MESTQFERLYLKYTMENPDYLHKVRQDFFRIKEYQLFFKIVKSFFERYSKVPTKKQFEQLLISKKLNDKLSSEAVDSVYDIDINEYEQEWLKDNFHAFLEYRNILIAVESVVDYAQTTDVNTDNINDFVYTIKKTLAENDSLGLDFNGGLDFYNAESHKSKRIERFRSGYPFLDEVLGGGYGYGNLVVLLGEPKVGKSLWLVNLACNAVRNGNNVCYITLELQDFEITQRCGANLLNLKMDEYSVLAEDPASLKQRIKDFRNEVASNTFVIPGQLFVKEFPMSTASVPDFESYIKREQEIHGVNFDVVIIDYIGIVKNWRIPNSENTYIKIKHISEDLRAMGQKNKWCVVTAMQVNRGAFASTDINITNIAEGASLAHTVDFMGAIIQDPLMYSDRSYIIKALLTRHAAAKNFRRKFLVEYEFMRIIEDPNSEKSTDEVEFRKIN